MPVPNIIGFNDQLTQKKIFIRIIFYPKQNEVRGYHIDQTKRKFSTFAN